MTGNSQPAPPECPVCGEPLEPHFRSCPNCGSCHQTGWREDAEDIDSTASLGIEDEFDYDTFVKKEFSKRHRPHSIPRWVWILGVIVLLAYLLRALS